MTILGVTLTGSALAIAGKIGLVGARHMPAPRSKSIAYRWLFQTIQDLASNNDRINEVRPDPTPIPNPNEETPPCPQPLP